MKVEELKIGNWYHQEDTRILTRNKLNLYTETIFLEKNICLVRKDLLLQLSNESVKPDFTPIELTEEWLLKFGLRKYLEYWLLDIQNDALYFHFKDDVWYWGHGSWSTKLEYVHQLQNLYFALTLEELTIKK